MKTLFAFFAILGIAGGILAFCFFSPVIAAFALFLYLLVGGGFVFSFAYNHGLRKKWLADPILPDSPEEKIERNDRCLKRLKVLTGMLDFNYGLRPY